MQHISLNKQGVLHQIIILPKTTNPLPQTNRLIRYFRSSRIVFHTLIGILIVAVILPLASKPTKLKLISWWCRYLLAAFNIRVISKGHIPPATSLGNNMFVSNHVSWADIHALNSIVPVKFIAKSEIKDWPIFGYLAKVNALFIDRAKRQDAARVVDITAQSLLDGYNLCLFPEGTTTNGTEIKPFKSSLIQAAIQAKATIWPVAIRYPLPNGGVNTAMAYAGEVTLPESMQAVLKQKNPVVELTFLQPIHLDNEVTKDRRTLTLHIEQLIRQELKL